MYPASSVRLFKAAHEISQPVPRRLVFWCLKIQNFIEFLEFFEDRLRVTDDLDEIGKPKSFKVAHLLFQPVPTQVVREEVECFLIVKHRANLNQTDGHRLG